MTARRGAAFLDRDGTLIEDTDYVRDPATVRLLPGAAAAVARLNAARVPVVVITNQSGLARKIFTMDDYVRVRDRLDELLAAEGARIDATYVCPHHPDFSGPCECRKPGTLLYRQAAEEMELDLALSLYVGDRWRDVQPALTVGGVGRLAASSVTPADERARAAAAGLEAPTLGDAVDAWLGARRPLSPSDPVR